MPISYRADVHLDVASSLLKRRSKATGSHEQFTPLFRNRDQEEAIRLALME